jgi:hypothetical protein
MIGMLFLTQCSNNNPHGYEYADSQLGETIELQWATLKSLLDDFATKDIKMLNFLQEMFAYKKNLTFQMPTLQYIISFLKSNPEALGKISLYLDHIILALKDKNLSLAQKYYDFMVIAMSKYLGNAIVRGYDSARPDYGEQNYGALELDEANKFDILRSATQNLMLQLENQDKKQEALNTILRVNFLR